MSDPTNENGGASGADPKTTNDKPPKPKKGFKANWNVKAPDGKLYAAGQTIPASVLNDEQVEELRKAGAIE